MLYKPLVPSEGLTLLGAADQGLAWVTPPWVAEEDICCLCHETEMLLDCTCVG